MPTTSSSSVVRRADDELDGEELAAARAHEDELRWTAQGARKLLLQESINHRLPFFACASDLDALAFELVSDDVLHLMGFAKLRFSAECR